MALKAPIKFLKQTFSSFNTTGAIAPSSSFLAKAMVSSLPQAQEVPDRFKVLEVGAGTGAFTEAIAARLAIRGELHLFEINPSFAQHLSQRIAAEECFKAMNERVKLTQGDIRELKTSGSYDAIISGLPFNNFTPDQVKEFLEHFGMLLKPAGTLTFFEYVAVRRIQMPFVGKKKRQRLKGVARVVEEFAEKYQYRQQIVTLNMPPARARHLRMHDRGT